MSALLEYAADEAVSRLVTTVHAADVLPFLLAYYAIAPDDCTKFLWRLAAGDAAIAGLRRQLRR